MTRRAKIMREIEAVTKLRDELYAEIHEPPCPEMDLSWFETRLTDIEDLDKILDDLAAILDVSILV